MPTRLTIRIDFDGERRLGPGKIALLEAIGETGSISAAGRRHAMSYRRAWLLVEELNHTFKQPLVVAHPGGPGGGGAEPDGGRQAGDRALPRSRAQDDAAAAGEIQEIEKALAETPKAPETGQPSAG